MERSRAHGRRKARISSILIACAIGLVLPSPLPAGATTGTDAVRLIRSIDLAAMVPPSPDPSGVTFLPGASNLLVADSEVEETPLYRDGNLFEMTQLGVFLKKGTTAPPNPKWFSKEPSGIAFDERTSTLLVVDDDQDDLSFVKAGADGIFGTGDDAVTEVDTRFLVGSSIADPEGVAIDQRTGIVYIVDGVGSRVYRWNPGPDARFFTADDVHANWDLARYGARDPEGIAWDPRTATLWVIDKRSVIYETDLNGNLLRTLDGTAAGALRPAGLEIAPSSADPLALSLWLVDRGIDNDYNPNQNDGRLFELTLGSGVPTVTITAPADDSTPPSGPVQFRGTARDPEDGDITRRITWSSNRDGVLGTGGALAATLTPGTHVVTATARDSGGAASSARITVTIASTLSIPVAVGADDAEETISGGSVSLTSSDLELGADGSKPQRVGLRFAVPAPQGASILSASVQFRTDEVSNGTASLTIRGQAADDAPAFAAKANDIGARALTAASVAWSPPNWPTINVVGPDQRTPNLAPIIEEIVRRPGWKAGNRLALVITGTGRRTADALEDGSAPVLHLQYDTTPPKTPPDLRISSPAAGSSHGLGASISFTATATDLADGDLAEAIEWTSSVDGSLGRGGSLARALSPGQHTIRARATDSDGQTGEASVTITVENQRPVVTISDPLPDSRHSWAGPVAFAGTVRDVEDGDRSADLRWSSSLDGDLGTGSGLSRSLSRGVHTITAAFTDAHGATGSAAVTIEVGDLAPTVSIASPEDGATFAGGSTVGFSGSAADAEDGDLAAGLTWHSTIDGALGTGPTVSRALANGTHEITARVTDSAGTTTSAVITLVVGQARVTSVPVAARADDAEEAVSNGSVDLASSDLELGVDGTKVQRVGLRFSNLPIPRGAKIVGAYVQFRTDEVSKGACSLSIRGHAADNAPAFTTTTNNIGSRASTSATVAWSPPEWTVIDLAGVDQRTPNLAPIVQEIVSRAGWNSGNALALVITGSGRRTADAIEDGYAPTLVVEWM